MKKKAKASWRVLLVISLRFSASSARTVSKPKAREQRELPPE
jgi:hypothetical protein